MRSSEIRQAFFDYFIAKDHKLIESASLVPVNDPTLLFTNAGMVPFKEIFLGNESRVYHRAVSSQRCVRAGGKHNDLENVGYTARHHTFFEMLGNFSFGDYFKREAIIYAWDFLTQVLKLPPEKLWVTVYQDDNEAADIWLNEVGISATRFSRCDERDNFWSMGDTGPCGPCTEIFYDHGADIPGGSPGSPDADGDRYIEIWNLVFMQYNRDKEGRLHPLPRPSVDTGMGLERIAAVVQGVHNNYDIDSFQYLIRAIITLIPQVDPLHPSLKVIADHSRACAFLIVDGVVPSNEGRGYVLRRIMRRAIRHGNKLGLPMPFFYQLVDPLIDVMGDVYPILATCREHIIQIMIREENQFERTLELGLRLLHAEMQLLQGNKITGEMAFKLYDTYGFPLDLTQDIAREKGVLVDIDGFNQLMQQQRELSQSVSQFTSDYSNADHVVSNLLHKSSIFHGYRTDSMPGRIVAILYEGDTIQQLNPGIKAGLVLDNSPFYAESGGQVGDTGQLIGQYFDEQTTNRAIFKVEDTQKIGQSIVHYGELLQGILLLNQEVLAQVDPIKRANVRLNHTATHLLHAALKRIVGAHVQQKGSLVEAQRARFDFSHDQALTTEQINQIETLVNEEIRANEKVVTETMSLNDAKRSNAVALFDEKYSDEVRVLTIGNFSKELCGGTHAARTGDIGLFKIIAEYGIASGVRRIEILTGSHAYNWVNQKLEILETLAKQLKTNSDNAMDKLVQIIQESKQQAKELATLQTQLIAKSGSELLADIEEIAGINLLIKQLKISDTQTLRSTLDELKGRMDNAVIVLFMIVQNKISVVAYVSNNLLGHGVPPATLLVKQLCGKGGGRDTMAQGGGEVPNNLDEKIKEIKTMLKINPKVI